MGHPENRLVDWLIELIELIELIKKKKS